MNEHVPSNETPKSRSKAKTFNPPHPAGFTSPSYPPDLLTWKTHLDAALGRFLGLSGTGIPADFLHLDTNKLLVRIPHEDAPRYMAAVSGWADEIEGRAVSFKVLDSTEFLMGIVGGDGSSLFR
ncbi:hypothetical protein ABW21_db0205108 [Orbilia brochopaga]|nr:hypothetical protein ABW21_db0205108 [Drechslerella brochopaga]